jgi:general stress protein 26
MAVSKPQLPPKEGYVEVEEEGKRVYKEVVTKTDEKIEQLWTDMANSYYQGVNEI